MTPQQMESRPALDYFPIQHESDSAVDLAVIDPLGLPCSVPLAVITMDSIALL